MSDEQAGAAAPAVEQAVTAPAVAEQATPTIESVPEGEATTENAETPGTEEGKQDESPSEKSQRLSRSQRQQRKLARLSTMLADQAAELSELRAKTTQGPQPPKESDFNGDYFEYQRALNKWDTEQVVNSALSKIIPQDRKPDVRDLEKQEIIDDLRERIGAARAHLPDFDVALGVLQRTVGDLSDAVLEGIGESEKGEFILYHLAKNPELAASINRMSEREATREIVRLEAKVSLPQPKRQTQAPTPLSTPKGGASPAKDMASLAKSEDISEFIKAERARKAAKGA
jgi:predicted transcriptional regulator